MHDSEGAHIVLIGPMGVGKTTLGFGLAAKLGRPFVDADREFELQEGVAGAELAADAGVEALHAVELDVFRGMVDAAEPSVIAAPASVIDTEEGRSLLSREVAVWLDADVETLMARSAHSTHRRVIDAAEVARLRALRSEWAPGCTVSTVDTRAPIEDCLDRIAAAVEPHVF